jgi:hypothetical protein
MGAAGSTNSFQWNNAGAFAGGGTGRLRKVDTNNVTNNNGLSDDTNVFFGELCGVALSHTAFTTMFGYRVAQNYIGGDENSFFGSDICTQIAGGYNGSSIFSSGESFNWIENTYICAFGYKLGYTDTGATISDPATEICVFGSASLQYQSGVTYDIQLQTECIFGHGVRTEIVDNVGGRFHNVFFGAHIFSTNNCPDETTIVGYRACYFTNGSDFRYGFNTSTVIGAKSMSDSSNPTVLHLDTPILLIGHEAGYSNVATQFSTFIGYRSGYFFRETDVQQGVTVQNTFIGNEISADTSAAGFQGIANTYIGRRTAYATSTNNYNVAIGYLAFQNSTGDNNNFNVIVGYAAGASVTSSQEGNVLLGSSANTTASNVVAIGQGASANSNGNVAIGQGASATGINSIAFGRLASVSGESSIAYGVCAGNRNILFGGTADEYNNICFGAASFESGNGNRNVVIGRGSMNSLVAGNDDSVTVGANIFNVGTHGRDVCIGFGAGVSSITGGTLTSSNMIAIGYQTRPRTGAAPASETQNPANIICLGNSSITNIYAQVTSITAISDARDKKNISEFSLGIEFIKKLNPVTFTWDMRDGGLKDVDSCGFIAQDVAEALKDCGAKDLGIVHGEGGEQMQLSEWKIFYAVIQGIKELSERNKMMREKLDLAGL